MESKFADNIEWKCTICMEWLKPGTKVHKLDCCASSIYCQSCYLDLIKDDNYNKNCPNCQKEQELKISYETSTKLTSNMRNCCSKFMKLIIHNLYYVLLVTEIVLSIILLVKIIPHHEHNYQIAFAICSNLFIYYIFIRMINSILDISDGNGHDYLFNKEIINYNSIYYTRTLFGSILRNLKNFKIIWASDKIKSEKVFCETGKNNHYCFSPIFIKYFGTIMNPKMLFTFILYVLHITDSLDNIVKPNKQLWIITAGNCLSFIFHIIHDYYGGGKSCFINNWIYEKNDEIYKNKKTSYYLMIILIKIIILPVNILLTTTFLSGADQTIKAIIYPIFSLSILFTFINFGYMDIDIDSFPNYYLDTSNDVKKIENAKLISLFGFVQIILKLFMLFTLATFYEAGFLTNIFGESREGFSLLFLYVISFIPTIIIISRKWCFKRIKVQKIKGSSLVVVPKYSFGQSKENEFTPSGI